MDNLSRVESIFFGALEKGSSDERAAYLDLACRENPQIRRHVERLLDAHPKAASFMNAPAGGLATTDEASITERPGTVIGPYRLMEQIGEGGMGLVFVADEQEPVRRRVALKIIKPGMDTREVIARFEAERQALALMDHPNIARVFDAGTTGSGRPYFVMELVKGVPIIEYCDQQQLTASERLELFLSVCRAVQHAHGKGIIHRDLKPNNILVAPHDGVPVVKVIDFGVAKAIGQQLTEKTIYTRFAQMIGTPLYMSPEQAEINALDVDIRSDVYSLGVLLYELLTGTTPFDRRRFATAAYDEIRRIIREEEPPRPSTRLSTLGETASAISAKRKTEPAKLSALMKGDLDWIVMKALEKDRNRRYETASAFAADVSRFLRNDTILARPPSTAYKLSKFVRRNRVAVLTVAAVAAALVVGTAVATWQAVRATLAEREAMHERDIAATAEREAVRQRDLAASAEQEATQQRDEARDASAKLQAAQHELRGTLYAAHMNLLQAAWETNNVDRGQELLRLTTPMPGESDPRGFEWHFWRRQFHAELQAVAIPGSHLASFSADGSRLCVLSEQGGPSRLFDVWDTTTRRQLAKLDPIIAPFESISPTSIMSPDGKRVASPVYEGNITGRETRGGLMVWDASTGKQLYVTKGESGPADSATFSPDGRVLAGVGRRSWHEKDGQFFIWDAATGEVVRVINVPGGKPGDLLFSPESARIAAIVSIGFSENRREPERSEVQVWDAGTGERVLTIPLRKGKGVHNKNLAFSPHGARLAVEESLAEYPGELRIFDATTGAELRSLAGPIGQGTCLAFSHDGTRLARGGFDGSLRVWDVDVRQAVTDTGPRATFIAHTGGVANIAFSADSKRLFSSGWWDGFEFFSGTGGSVKTWDATADHRPRIFTELSVAARTIAMSGDGQRVVAAGYGMGKDDTIPVRGKIWDRAGAELGAFQSPTRPHEWFGIQARLAISRNGARVAMAVAGFDQPKKEDDGMLSV